MTVSRLLAAFGCGAAVCLGSVAVAQERPQVSPGVAPEPNTGDPRRDTLVKMSRRVTVEFNEHRLEDVLRYIADMTTADLDIMWADGRQAIGLDREELITLSVRDVPFMTLLERVLDRAQVEFQENTWQLDRFGALQVGPKARLNRYKRVEVYDIHDLILELPEYDEVPQIDLQQAMQQGRGGGGQSPFRQDQDQDRDRLSVEQRAEEVMNLLLEFVEVEQWVANGGEGGTMRMWRTSLIVNAPDYMHRQINGYRFWPSRLQSGRMVEGRRYVSLGLDTGLSTVDGFGQHPVSAVVGGEIVRSGPGGGG